ncbi:MAG: S-layer homology domain-containing protein, partial [Peptococcaceae bacterium]
TTQHNTTQPLKATSQNNATILEVSDADGLVEAVKTDNAQIVLENDITLDSSLTIDKPVTIDGQGHTITGTVNLQNGTVQDTTFTNVEKKEILTIGSKNQDVVIKLVGCTVLYPSGAITSSNDRSTISHTLAGNAATVTIDGCKFINDGRSETEWSYGLYFNAQNGGTINFTNNEFSGAFRTMLPSVNGKVTIKNNVFTNFVYSVTNGPTTGSQAEATCITTAKASANDEFVITDNIFNNAGAFYFQQTEKTTVHNNTFNFDTFEHYIEVNISAAHPLDLTNNTFMMGSNNLVIVDKTVAPVQLPVGQRAVSYYSWAKTPEAIRPADYSTYGYAYNADGTMSFYPGSEGALQAFITPATGNIGIQDGDTVTLTDNISLDGTGKGNNEGLLTLDKDILFDGNGKTLTARNVTVSEGKDPSIINIVDGAKVTVRNLTIDGQAGDANTKHGLNVYGDDTAVTVENVTITNGNGYGMVVNGAQATVNGLTTSNNKWGGINVDSKSGAANLTINHATIGENNSVKIENGSNGTQTDPAVDIKDGQFQYVTTGSEIAAPDVTISGGKFATGTLPEGAVDITEHLAPGLAVDGNGNVYTPSSGGGSSSGNKTETTVNPDGSITTTVTRPNGSKTETTKYPDGSKEVVDTKKDGTVTTTLTDKDGNKTETVEKTNGSSTTTITKADGSTSTTTVSKDGDVNTTVTLPSDVIDDAKGNAIPLPMPELTVSKDADKAPTVTVDLPNNQHAKVEVPVKDVTAGTVAILVKEDGTEEIIKATLQSENGVIVTLADGDTIKIIDNSKDFVDVADNFWAAETIDFATSRGLFGGTSDTTFSPNMAMNRAMIVTVLARLDGADTSGGDVWYEKGREWAMKNGISDGNNMMDNLTREQLVTMLWRYAGKPSSNHSLSDYKDAAAVSDFAKDAFAWAVEEGLITGTTADTLSPQGTATRAQVAAILTRFCTNIAK